MRKLSWYFILPLVILVSNISKAADPPIYDQPGIPDAERGTYRMWVPGIENAIYNDNVMNSKRSTGATALHEIGVRGQGVTAAVVDDGFYTGHEIFNDGKIVNDYQGVT
ncbi:MAG: hypothetical protein LBT89_08325, partial [Planctomycetaceae bacterium]|nr:hypothetical protein [Planctomycetaceae bacterium]